MQSELITESFELAAARCEDLTPLVYKRLFAARPELEALFIRDKTGAVKGEMLAKTIDVIFDFIDKRAFADNFIACEIMTHAGYDVPPQDFPMFFEMLADTLREVVGDRWSEGMEDAWRDLLAQLGRYATMPS